MGVTGSHCQLCRLPLNHDHYVPEVGGRMLKIYRTSSEGGGHEFAPDELVVRFGPEHAWLCDAVAVPVGAGNVLHGRVEDGILKDAATGETSFIWKGDDDALAFHTWCWKLMGSPTTAEQAVRGGGLHAWAVVETYDGQLFEHHEFRAAGFGWMLDDPTGSPPSRERIERMYARAKVRPTADQFPSVREVVAAEHAWSGLTLRDEHHAVRHAIHYRENLHVGLNTASYAALVWAIKELAAAGIPTGDTMQALADYEVALIAAVERDDAAIVLMTTLGDDQVQYLVQARDEAATRAVIEALPSPDGTKAVEFDNEQDPQWNNFFKNMNPQLHGR